MAQTKRPAFSGWYYTLPPSGHMGLHLGANSSNDQEALADWLEGRRNDFTKLSLDVQRGQRARNMVYLEKIVVHRESDHSVCWLHERELTINLTQQDGHRVANILRTIDAWNEGNIVIDTDRKPTLLWFWHAG